MKLIRSIAWVGVVVGSVSVTLGGCSTTESLGTGETERRDDGGPKGSAGSDGTGGRSSGGAGGGGENAGSGGENAGSGGGNQGTGGRPIDCRLVDCAPPTCADGEVLMHDDEHCCGVCVPQDSITHASCIIGGVRYAHLAVVERTACTSCLCVDGHIGRCTGACEPDAGAFIERPLPTCGDGESLIEACSECGPTDACSAFEFKCRKAGACETGGSECGAGKYCLKGACVDALQCG